MAGSIRTLKGINYKLLDYELQKCQLDELIKANITLSNIFTVNKQIQEQTDEIEAQLYSIEKAIKGGIHSIILSIENASSTEISNLQEIKSSIIEGNVVLSTIKTGIDSVDTAIQSLDTDLQTKLKEIVKNQLLDSEKQSRIIQGIKDQNLTLNEISEFVEDSVQEIKIVRLSLNNVITKLDDLIKKPLVSEVIGCINVKVRLNSNSDFSGYYGVRYTYRDGQIGAGDKLYLNGSDVALVNVGESIHTLPQKVIDERLYLSLLSLGYNPDKSKTTLIISKYNDFNILNVVSNVKLDNYNTIKPNINSTTSPVTDEVYLYNIKASLVKEYDNFGNEVVTKRKYYSGGKEVPLNQVKSFYEGGCTEGSKKSKQEILEGVSKTYTGYSSISVTVCNGTADITLNGTKVTYPIESGVSGISFSDENILNDILLIDAQQGKVLVTLIE